jgi:hypothetical protein
MGFNVDKPGVDKSDLGEQFDCLQDAWIEAIAERLFPEEIHVNNLILTKEVIHEGL